jgi:hypothetical protein
MKQQLEKLKKLYHHKGLRPVFDVGIFAILLMSFHYIYIWWAGTGFYPFSHQVDQLFDFAFT